MLPAYLRLRSLRVLHSRSGTVQFFKREGRTMLDGIFPHRSPFVMQPAAYLHFLSELFQPILVTLWISMSSRLDFAVSQKNNRGSGGLFGIPWFSIS